MYSVVANELHSDTDKIKTFNRMSKSNFDNLVGTYGITVPVEERILISVHD